MNTFINIGENNIMNGKIFLLTTTIIILISGCVEMEKTTIITEDGVKIIGEYWDANTTKAILLLHMMPATKESWHVITNDLNKQGYKVLTIDLRGHGESTETTTGETLNYRTFNDEEHQTSTLDVQAALKFLEQKGAREYAIIGASIGANLALIQASEDERVKNVVLLSPGLNYRGLKLEKTAQKFKKPTLIIASQEDTYSANSSKTLHELIENSELIMLNNKGHGTNMFTQPGLKQKIINWVTNHT